MRICVLGSGSAGNAILIEGPKGFLLVDAGLPWRELHLRAKKAGIHLTLPKVVLTHEHADHVRGLDTLLRRGAKIMASPGTLSALGIAGVSLIGELEVAGIKLSSFSVPHDAAEPVGVRLWADGFQVGIVTDLGRMPQEALFALRGCSVVVMEANYDLALLLSGPYPWPIKLRIMGPKGHLANDIAAWSLAKLTEDGLQAAFLAHLSQENNTPRLAWETAARALESWTGKLCLTYPDRPSAVVSA